MQSAFSQPSEGPARVLLVTGQEYPGHPWKQTAPALAAALREDPRLRVEIIEDPHALSTIALEKYAVVLIHFMNWEQPAPGDQARANLKKFVENGGGIATVHFACGAWQDWPEFKSIVGRVWDPKLRGHDPRGKFRVEIADPKHPITQGLASFETDDELYTCLTGDAPIHVVAQARSAVDGKDYPMAFTVQYGRGRTFHCVLGHDLTAITIPAVKDLYRRGVAWSAGLAPVPREKLEKTPAVPQ